MVERDRVRERQRERSKFQGQKNYLIQPREGEYNEMVSVKLR